jgi:membrane-bound ClpP family serine protease
MFGALYATMAVKDPILGVICLVLCIVCRIISLPSWALVMVAVFGSILLARLLYKQGVIK